MIIVRDNITEYVYSAEGQRIKTRYTTVVPNSSSTTSKEILSVDSVEYLDDYVFENRAFKRYNFETGYIAPKGKNELPYYYCKDHLGNNRVVTDNSGTIVQSNQYYPYGVTHNRSKNQDAQSYKYNGKELDRMHGLDWYDYSARQYDATIDQFTSMDPLCEKYYHISPYTYCAGNPVKYVDPDGRAINIRYIDVYGKTQYFLFQDTNQKGTIKIPKSRNDYVKNVVGAYLYNKRNYSKMFPGQKSGLMKLVQRNDDKNTVIVADGSNSPYKDVYNRRENILYWDAHAATKRSNGITNSPATNLAHEGEHANNNTESIESSLNYSQRCKTPDNIYGDAEEKIVIMGVEQKQAEANGEVQRGQKNRENHEGTYFPVNNYWER